MPQNHNQKIFLTGGCGFIGYHLSKSLLNNGHEVLCIDNLNDYYDVGLKKERLSMLDQHENFKFKKIDLTDYDGLFETLKYFNADIVINLAAQAGVRYSIQNPISYLNSNLIGFFHLIECSRILKIKKIIYASSSSIYGDSAITPFNENLKEIKPLSLYASTKYSNELIANNYFNSFNISFIGLRFFTVYGIFGRPDMAYYDFTKKILNEEEILIFNKGKMSRDMTHVSDIVQGINGAINYMINSNLTINEVFNLGNNHPVSLWDLINFISKKTGKDVKYVYKKSNTEVETTYADISKSNKYLGYKPKIKFEDGMLEFIEWYQSRL